jgi:hypothetical protein
VGKSRLSAAAALELLDAKTRPACTDGAGR